MSGLFNETFSIETDFEKARRLFTKEDILSRIIVDEKTGCWLWQGATNHKGYGQLGREGHTMVAHKIAYLLFVGPYNPSRHELHHTCLTKRCANYAHVEPKTPSTHPGTINEKRRNATHCKRGHEYTQENTRVFFMNGRKCRECRACIKIRNDENYATKRYR